MSNTLSELGIEIKGTVPKNNFIIEWATEMAKMCKPNCIEFLNGSDDEEKRLIREALKSGELIELNQEKLPGCYLHRSAHNDVARTEELTFVCTEKEEDVGPTNNWMLPKDAYKKLTEIFDGSMKGRTMYVIPFLMGPPKSIFNKVGIELTDSLYVVLNMHKVTRMGKIALDELNDSNDFTRCLHSKADLNDKRRFICHFPEDNTIWSIGSGYGGNALLGKKCLALRIASFLGKKEGWLAEHMLIMGLENPKGEKHYIAAAFPSACGKTNLAMLIPPESLKGWKIWTVGDDIAWMRIGKDGRLWAVNPEAGFFGVVPGTSNKSNPIAMETIQKNTIFTNVVMKDDGTVWWEGCGEEKPKNAANWKGELWISDEKGAHPNARFTVSIKQCAAVSPEWANPNGVPIDAIVFGGRRAKLAPLVYQSFDWQHGIFIGATMASERTAAQAGAVGELRMDPMAMIPFAGYNMADYFKHWLEMGKKIKNAPKIFHVNWFRTDKDGNFLWPGFGENLRVLKWIIERVKEKSKTEATETPIGHVPTKKSLHLEGLNISEEDIEALLKIDKGAWLEEVKEQKTFLKKFGNRMPNEILEEHEKLKERLKGN